MAIIVRYELRTAVSFLPIIHRFQTQAAALHFIDRSVPAEAKNLSVYRDDSDEPKQAPTWAGRAEPRNRWWDENKRPFTDRYTAEDQVL